MKNQRLVVVHSPSSTVSKRYNHSVRPELLAISTNVQEIVLSDVPYVVARDKIIEELRDGDIVIAAGGDGLVNVTLDAVLTSGREVTCAVMPLGNFNDFGRAVNGRTHDLAKILSSQIVDFHPLDLIVNGRHELYGMQYITFGASAELTDWLNAPETRQLRRKLRGNSALFGAVCVLNYNKIFGSLGDIRSIIPSFERNGKTHNENNIGFMIGGIGGYFYPKPGNLHLFDQQFWFHYANLTGKAGRDVPYLTSWFGRRIPGEMSDHEKLLFREPIDLVTQVAGDKLLFENVREIACLRSKKPLRLYMPNANSLLR